MASSKNLEEELECPICKDYFKVPKVMGTCLHVACLECLQQLVASRPSRRTYFRCPVCRGKCRIPTGGVAAFKDDFRLRAIVENYQRLKKEKNVIRCIACSNRASHCCKQCENSYICKDCSKKHSHDPLTSAHDLFGICSKHCKSLALYCRKCNTAICAACLIVDHPSSSQEHDVVPHQQVAGEEVAAVVTGFEKLENIMEKKEIALLNIFGIRNTVATTIDSDLSSLDKQSDSVIERSNKTRVDLIAEKGSIQKQINALIRREKVVDEKIVATEKKMAADLQKKIEYSDYLKSYRSAFIKKFEEAATQAVAETIDIEANLELGRKGKSTKEVLNDKSVPTLLKIKEGLRQTLTTAEQVDRAAQFVDAEQRMPRFVPASDCTDMGFIRRKFKTLKKFADISFPAYRPCKSVGSVRHLSDGRLACLYQSRTEEYRYRPWVCQGDTIVLHDHNSGSAFPVASLVVMDRNIHSAVAMTVTSKGERMVLYDSKFVRIFSNDGYRDIHLYCLFSSESLPFIECDGEDNIFALFFSLIGDFLSPRLSIILRVCKPDGIPITEISESGFPGVMLMSFCRLRRIIYLLVPHNVMLRYHWDGTTLKKMQSIKLPFVSEFSYDDVCIDNFGTLFVAGHDRGEEVHIYQVMQAGLPVRQTEDAASNIHGEKLCSNDADSSVEKEDEGIECTMIELSFEDKVRRLAKIRRGLVPGKGIVISISGDTLALGYGKQIELFHLLP